MTIFITSDAKQYGLGNNCPDLACCIDSPEKQMNLVEARNTINKHVALEDSGWLILTISTIIFRYLCTQLIPQVIGNYISRSQSLSAIYASVLNRYVVKQ